MNPPSDNNSEKFLTIKDAAKVIGVPEWKLRAAVSQELVPSYKIFNKRRYVLISDVLNAMRADYDF